MFFHGRLELTSSAAGAEHLTLGTVCPVCAEPQPRGFGVPMALEQGMRELVQTLELLQCAGQLCHCPAV